MKAYLQHHPRKFERIDYEPAGRTAAIMVGLPLCTGAVVVVMLWGAVRGWW